MEYSEQHNDQSSIVREADDQKVYDDQLREALKRSYTERFLMATRLYKIQKTMSKAKITHKPLR